MSAATPRSTQDEEESPSQPPKKRRRITKDTEDAKGLQQQQHLDLSSDEVDGDEQEQLDRLLKVLHKRRKIGGCLSRSFRYVWGDIVTDFDACASCCRGCRHFCLGGYT